MLENWFWTSLTAAWAAAWAAAFWTCWPMAPKAWVAAEPATVAAWFRPLLLVDAAVCVGGFQEIDAAVREERDRVEWQKRGNRKVRGKRREKEKKRKIKSFEAGWCKFLCFHSDDIFCVFWEDPFFA